MRSVVIVGASLAGLSSARALREQGFDGRISIVGDEVHRPYDRPPLSKEFLAGADERLTLETPDDAALEIDWRLGSAAVAMDCRHRSITLACGEELVADGVVVATGASAIALPGTRGIAGIHVLRSLDDARALRDELAGGTRVAIVGAGFLGSEIASTAVGLGAEVTLIEAAGTPLQRVLGSRIGGLLANLHVRAGAELITGATVAGFATRAGRVAGVELCDGRRVASDVVVVSIGSTPNIGWLSGSGVELANGVVTDQRGVTSIPGVVAVGDCAAVRDCATGEFTRAEHWTAAATRPAIAVKGLLSGGTSADTFDPVPYVWSELYRQRIQFAGHQAPDCEIEIVDGDPADGPFVAVYRRAGEPQAVLAVSSPRSFGKWRRQLRGEAMSHRNDRRPEDSRSVARIVRPPTPN